MLLSTRRLRTSCVVMSMALLSYLFVGSVAQSASAATTKPSTINVDNLVLPDGISAVMISDYSKAPDVKAEGTKPYSCLAIYLVSSLSRTTVVHVSGLTLATSDGGKSILYGKTLNGYLTIRGKTADTDALSSSQALGRLSPSGKYSDLQASAISLNPVPDTYDCQSASRERMSGLTIDSSVDYLSNKTLYLAGQVDVATPSTYDIKSVTVPTGYEAVLAYKNASGYTASCITRDGQQTQIGIALKPSSPPVSGAAAGPFIARKVTVNGVDYPTLGFPTARQVPQRCIPVAIVPNDATGDISGDHEIVITADIVEWQPSIVNNFTVTGSKMAKIELGWSDSDKVKVTYSPVVKKSFLWLTTKSRGSLVKCSGTNFDLSGLTASYVASGVTTRGVKLLTSTAAKKYATSVASSGGGDTHAVISFSGNLFEDDGKLSLSGKGIATDQCKK
jgi:hypothetical protein